MTPTPKPHSTLGPPFLTQFRPEFDAILTPNLGHSQRKRDDNKNKICAFQGGGVGRGPGRKIVQNAIFHGKRHDNQILKVNILLSRNFVVMAQAPKFAYFLEISYFKLEISCL